MNTPSLYHDEAADFVNETLCTDINPWDIQRYLKRIKWTRKKLKVRAAQRNATLRANHALQFANYSMDMLVFLDESSIDNRCTYRKFGYSPEGTPACEDRRLARGLRWSLLPAFSMNADDLLVHLGLGLASRTRSLGVWLSWITVLHIMIQGNHIFDAQGLDEAQP
ncbi:hypothetical protein G7K_6481-t1 [Saitoella complicata NRRL Y-17804]|uniref:Uncharacterized protein n=1 Tax=Saitoella complicata (strain BCRC 22490 / CBS 7301 / JCM 7358 / NBRC 10748 / NRRL Y-17804) TaxID=698492 RepID=A0A0E9NRJ7_SAICN|nr:hypothetical protein G7K_6481-t1 [Saitoella complicata NRRL Y-17804]